MSRNDQFAIQTKQQKIFTTPSTDQNTTNHSEETLTITLNRVTDN